MSFKNYKKRSPSRATNVKQIAGTPQQEDFWKAITKTDDHVFLRALAGTGKTFSLVQAILRYVELAALCCFNKSIATEATTKVPHGTPVGTMHSFCYKELRKWNPSIKVNNSKPYKVLESMRVADWDLRNLIIKYGALTKMLNPFTTSPSVDFLNDLTLKYGIEGNGLQAKAYRLLPTYLERCREEENLIDFDDMLWFVLTHEIPVTRYPMLMVDEAQDLNTCQHEIACLMGERLVMVGDRHQAIYGFRGADVKSMDNMATLLLERDGTKRSVRELPLTVTFRCPKSHVAEARKIVPEFEAHESAPQGKISADHIESVLRYLTPGNLVMSRVNAPLMGVAYQLIQMDVPVQVAGRDIGSGFTSLIKKLRKKSNWTTSVNQVLANLDDYSEVETQRLLGEKYPSESKIQNLEDKCTCLRILCQGEKDIENVEKRIKTLFADVAGEQRKKVTLSSVHRAKGLEADSTYILRPELMPHPMAKQAWEKEQEHNIKYVALTRSKDSMTKVSMDD